MPTGKKSATSRRESLASKLPVGVETMYVEAGYMLRHYSLSRNAMLSVSFPIIVGSMLLLIREINEADTDKFYSILLYAFQLLFFVIISFVTVGFSKLIVGLQNAMKGLENAGTEFGPHSLISRINSRNIFNRRSSDELNERQEWDIYSKLFIYVVGLIEAILFGFLALNLGR